MHGMARKAETARHDRHAVEKDAGKRRLGIRKYLALGHRSLYMSGNRTKESIIGFLKKVNRDACGRAGRPQFHAFARAGPRSAARLRTPPLALGRSEEHTSELQSLMRISYAVFCLKKKKKKYNKRT